MIDFSQYTEDADDELTGEGQSGSKRSFDKMASKTIKVEASVNRSIGPEPIMKETASFEDLIRSDRVGYCITADANGKDEYWVSCPLGVVNYRDGVHACDPDGRASLSSFKILSYCEDSDTTLLECQPYTGPVHFRLTIKLQAFL